MDLVLKGHIDRYNDEHSLFAETEWKYVGDDGFARIMIVRKHAYESGFTSSFLVLYSDGGELDANHSTILTLKTYVSELGVSKFLAGTSTSIPKMKLYYEQDADYYYIFASGAVFYGKLFIYFLRGTKGIAEGVFGERFTRSVASYTAIPCVEEVLNTTINSRIQSKSIVQKADGDFAFTVGKDETMAAYWAPTAPRTVTLPDPSLVPNQVKWIKDENNLFGAFPVTVVSASIDATVKRIDKQASKVLDYNGISIGFFSSGTEWFTFSGQEYATTSKLGIARFATETEINQGTNTKVFTSAADLKKALSLYKFNQVAYTVMGDATNAGKWAKIAEVNLKDVVNTDFSLIQAITIATASPQSALVSFTGRQNGIGQPLSNLEVDIISMSTGEAFSERNFKMVGNGFNTPLSIYVKKNNVFGIVSVSEVAKSLPNSATLTYSAASTWIDEPTGSIGVFSKFPNDKRYAQFTRVSVVANGALTTFTIPHTLGVKPSYIGSANPRNLETANGGVKWVDATAENFIIYTNTAIVNGATASWELTYRI